MMSTNRAVSLAVLILSLVPLVVCLTIVSPAQHAGKRINSPLVNPALYKYHPARGPIIDGNVNGSCAELAGKIVLLANESTPGAPLQAITYKMQECGALAVIYRDKTSDYAGLLGATYTEISPLINISMVGVSKVDGPFLVSLIAEAAANATYVIIDLEGSQFDINYWDLWGDIPVGIALQVILAFFSGGVTVLSLAKLIAFIRAVGFQPFTVPQAVLLIRIASNWFRTIYWATDPMFLGRFYSFSVGQILLTISFPFEIVGTLVFAFYWSELLSKKRVKVSNFLTTMRIPIIVISVLLIIMELTFAVLRAALFDLAVLSIISSVAYIVVTVSASIYFVYMGVKVVLQLRANSTSKSFGAGTAALIRRTVIFVCLTAGFSFVWALTIIGAIADEFLNNPFYFRSLIFTWFALVTCNSLVSVLSVRAPFHGVLPDMTTHQGSSQRSTNSEKSSSRQD